MKCSFLFCSFLQISCYSVLLFTVCPTVFLIYTYDLVYYFALPLIYSLLSFLLFSSKFSPYGLKEAFSSPILLCSSPIVLLFSVVPAFSYSPLFSPLLQFSFVLPPSPILLCSPPFSYSPLFPPSPILLCSPPLVLLFSIVPTFSYSPLFSPFSYSPLFSPLLLFSVVPPFSYSQLFPPSPILRCSPPSPIHFCNPLLFSSLLFSSLLFSSFKLFRTKSEL